MLLFVYPAYHHVVGRAVEMMIADAIVKAAPHLKVGGKILEECITDMEAYTKLHDGIFMQVGIFLWAS